MAIYAREPTDEEQRQLIVWRDGEDPNMRHRARVILLSAEGYRVPEIASLTKHNPVNIRRWIKKFNEEGIEGLKTRHSGGPRITFKPVARQEIIRLAREGNHGRRWTLCGLAKAAVELGIVDKISYETVRQFLLEAGVDWRHI